MKLLAHQETGVEFMLRTPRCILADEMGLGKTVQAIELINRLKPKSTIIVCPAFLQLNWSQELDRWLKFNLAPVNVTSYGMLSKFDIDSIDLLIADEAHYAKSNNSLRSQSLQRLASKAKRVVLLTGTPLLS